MAENLLPYVVFFMVMGLLGGVMSFIAVVFTFKAYAKVIGMENSTHNIEYIDPFNKKDSFETDVDVINSELKDEEEGEFGMSYEDIEKLNEEVKDSGVII